jgi:hypothetical protein
VPPPASEAASARVTPTEAASARLTPPQTYTPGQSSILEYWVKEANGPVILTSPRNRREPVACGLIFIERLRRPCWRFWGGPNRRTPTLCRGTHTQVNRAPPLPETPSVTDLKR